jgi:SAM-dependent methyltransferase
MRLKEAWRQHTPEQVQQFLRAGPEGRDHPSRLKAIGLLEGINSVLDVGCGTGMMFELMLEQWPDIDYLGIDTTEQFVQAARERYPVHADRFQQGSLYELDKLCREFDAVLCRHVLEHLPDYVPAIQRMYAVARRKLIIIFYLPPQPLRFRRRRDERFEQGFYTHTYDLGGFVDHLLNKLSPACSEVRIHPRQGSSDPRCPWGDRENVIYEVIRTEEETGVLDVCQRNGQ